MQDPVFGGDTQYKHKEAFCLMLYQCQKTKHVIDIWNSRDGVTPFIVHIDGDEYGHIAFNFDRCVPWFRPKPGQYIFRTMTKADADRHVASAIARRPELKGHEAEIYESMRVGEGPELDQVGRKATGN